MDACKLVMERLSTKYCTREVFNSLFRPPCTLQQLSLNTIVNDKRCRSQVSRRFSLQIMRIVLQYLQNCDNYLRFGSTLYCLCGKLMGQCSCIFHWSRKTELLAFKSQLTARLINFSLDENDRFIDFEDRMLTMPCILQFPIQPVFTNETLLHIAPHNWKPLHPRDWIILMNYPYEKRLIFDEQHTFCFINKYRCRSGPCETIENLCYWCYSKITDKPCSIVRIRRDHEKEFLREIIWDPSNWCDRCMFQPLFLLLEEYD